VNIDLPWPAFLPRDYVAGQKQKIEIYRRLARIRRPDRLDDFRQELRDRFGPIPEAAEWLLRLAELRILATRWQIASIHLEGKGLEHTPPKPPIDLVLGYRHPRKIEKLVKRSEGRLRIVDKSTAFFRLKVEEMDPLPLYACIKDLLRLPERQV